MEIGGIVRNSFVDYPGVISAVVFTTGCNYNCWYCHNSHILHKKGSISEEKVFSFLEERKKFLDGVVVSGGEPTLQKDLIPFVKKIKDRGYLVKLDTNGSNFEVLKTLVENKLVDYVAMDIKAPFNKYEMIVTVKRSLENEKKSIEFLMKGIVDYEFRTTYSPDLNLDDIEEICKMIEGAKRYSIQKYRTVDYNVKNMPEKKKDEMEEAGRIAQKYIKEVLVKGI